MFIYLDNEAGRFYIVMEYCEEGDLSKTMQTQKDYRFFEEKQVHFFMPTYSTYIHTVYSSLYPLNNSNTKCFNILDLKS